MTGIWEWIGPFYPSKAQGAPGYTASAANTYFASEQLRCWESPAEAAAAQATAAAETTATPKCAAPVAPPETPEKPQLDSALTCAIETDATDASAASAAMEVSVDPAKLLPGAYVDVRAVQYLPARGGPRRKVRVASISDSDPSSKAVDILTTTLAELDALGAAGVDVSGLTRARNRCHARSVSDARHCCR